MFENRKMHWGCFPSKKEGNKKDISGKSTTFGQSNN
jgi:hypothetical protein